MAQAEVPVWITEKNTRKKVANDAQKKALDFLVPEYGCSGKPKNSISASEYDELVGKMVADFNPYQRAIDKIGLDEEELQEIPPVSFSGYEDESFQQFYQFGTDGLIRTDVYSVTYILFSATQVYLYKLVFNTTKNDKKEQTEEYFYKDITNFSTTSDTKASVVTTPGSGCKKEKNEERSTEVQKFALIVPGDKFYCATTGDIEQSVKAMKAKLREKKNG